MTPPGCYIIQTQRRRLAGKHSSFMLYWKVRAAISTLPIRISSWSPGMNIIVLFWPGALRLTALPFGWLLDGILAVPWPSILAMHVGIAPFWIGLPSCSSVFAPVIYHPLPATGIHIWPQYNGWFCRPSSWRLLACLLSCVQCNLLISASFYAYIQQPSLQQCVCIHVCNLRAYHSLSPNSILQRDIWSQFVVNCIRGMHLYFLNWYLIIVITHDLRIILSPVSLIGTFNH